MGCSTWNTGELQFDWELKLPDLLSLDLSSKLVAMFGVGDQRGYSDTFQDAMGILGAWPAKNYRFEASKGRRGDKFLGHALDYTNQEDLNGARIRSWIELLIGDFALPVIHSST